MAFTARQRQLCAIALFVTASCVHAQTSGQAPAQTSIAPAPALTAAQHLMFSLDGRLEPVQAEQSAAPGATPMGALAGEERVADMDNGSTIWDNACAACHGELGQGGHGGGSDIRNSPLSLSQIMLVVNAGRNTMPAFAGFSEQELLDISTYVKSSL